MSEASFLLKHPDPRERALALKMGSVSPQDVAQAILDPDERVWQAAFKHPLAEYALKVLASSHRDAAGNFLHSRHDLLMNDPRCRKAHLEAMERATQTDPHLPLQVQAQRLRALKEHPAQAKLQKSEEAAKALGSVSAKMPVADHTKEVNLHPDLHQHFEEHKYGLKQAGDPDLGRDPGITHKYVAETPTHKFILKPYSYHTNPLQGWAESTSQALYHAAEIPHLHQQSVVTTVGEDKVPVTAIHRDVTSVPVHKVPRDELHKNNPDAHDEIAKIVAMDYLTSNVDRHSDNLRVTKNGHLLAIDHGSAFFPFDGASSDTFDVYSHASGPLAVTGHGDIEKYLPVIRTWWPKVKNGVRRSFEQQLELITHPEYKEAIDHEFTRRWNWLGSVAEHGLMKSEPLLKMVAPLKLDNKPHKLLKGLHKEVMRIHPVKGNKYVPQEQVDAFENHVNHPTAVHHSAKINVGGSEDKELFNHADRKYLVKGAASRHNPASVWSEMTSQAMYHAGGLGHLHQQVHVTNIKNSQGKTHNAMVVHFPQGKWDVMGYVPINRSVNAGKTYQDSINRFDTMVKNHAPDLRKSVLMDFLTGNTDRHSDNILINHEGKPLLIDHGFSFIHDLRHGLQTENRDGEVEHVTPQDQETKGKWRSWRNFNELATQNILPDEETWKWWEQNKGPITKAFYENLEAIPDKEVRQRMGASFAHRLQAVNNRHEVLQDLSAKPLITRPLKKAMTGVGFLAGQHAHPMVNSPNMAGVHDKLKMAHPKSVVPGLRHFELNINQSKTPIKPTVEYKPDPHRSMGEEPKSIFEHGGKRYMVKAASGPHSKMTGWNEMTSQAMYHSAGIGHLHQPVHATSHKFHGGPEDTGAVVIQMADKGAMSLLNADGYAPQGVEPQDRARVNKMMDRPEVMQSLKRVGLMDELTSNPDRHVGNIMVHPNGDILAIDHGRAFWADRKHAIGIEGEQREEEIQGLDRFNNNPYEQLQYNVGSDAARYGGQPDEETWKWWDQNKHNLRNTFQKHVNMLPDPNVRAKMLQSFDVRWNDLNERRDRFTDRGQTEGNSFVPPTIQSNVAGEKTINENPSKRVANQG